MIERLACMGPDPHSVAIYGGVLAAFFVICYPPALLTGWLERRMRV